MKDELLQVCKRMQRNETHNHLLSLYPKGELIEIIDGLIDSVDALEEKHKNLITELEALPIKMKWEQDNCAEFDYVKALIDKYKGGE